MPNVLLFFLWVMFCIPLTSSLVDGHGKRVGVDAGWLNVGCIISLIVVFPSFFILLVERQWLLFGVT